MPTNHYIQDHTYSGEQDLVEDLIIEAIQYAGIGVYYVPRESATGLQDYLFGEDILSKFTTAYPVEMYVDRVDGFEGNAELMSKFGLMVNNTIEFDVSIRRFKEATSGHFIRPREGDLIYFRFKPALFEITYVADKVEFFQLHKLYMYRLTTEIFKYGQESIQTGIQEIDALQTKLGYQLDFILSSGTGDYQVGETVAIGAASAKVVSWNTTTNTLRVQDIEGVPASNENVIGGSSGTSRTLVSYDDLVDMGEEEAINNEIRDEANTVIDFSEDNPFSESRP